MMMSSPSKVPSPAIILVFGTLTAVLLLVVLMNSLRSELRSQLSEGNHRANDVALAVAQAARAPLRASANSMTFIAEETSRLQRAAPLQSGALIKGLITEILQRQPQIQNVTFMGAASSNGNSLLPAAVDGVWALCNMRAFPAS